MNGYTNAETWRFCAIIGNDEELYNAVDSFVATVLMHVPSIDDLTLGRNVKDRVFAWANGGGWGFDNEPRFQHVLADLSRDDYPYVNEKEVGQCVLEMKQ